MKRAKAGVAAILLLAALGAGAAGCARSEAASTEGGGEESASAKAATVEKVPGSDVSKVILTRDAVRRLGIQTGRVTGAQGRTAAIPYGALLYDENGATWTFTNPSPLTYVRSKVTVAAIRGDQVRLRAGPPVGTAIVTVGATELLGAELGVGGE
jgi:hypothetical protein